MICERSVEEVILLLCTLQERFSVFHFRSVLPDKKSDRKGNGITCRSVMWTEQRA